VSTTAEAQTTVFIAEDNPILLQGLERALSAHGYAVNTAINGKVMLDMLQQSPLPDILLVDVMMPVMNGLELLDAVRTDPRTADIPVNKMGR
jgi:CheY-like chemotaxis protein